MKTATQFESLNLDTDAGGVWLQAAAALQQRVLQFFTAQRAGDQAFAAASPHDAVQNAAQRQQLFAHLQSAGLESVLQAYVEDCVYTRTAELLQRNAVLASLAHTDSLTNLPNRRAFLERAENELARMQRYGQRACVLMGDIDSYKAFNDRWGHACGDRVLQVVANALRSGTRTTDMVARWGGEEFVLLLPETELAAAQLVAEKCRTAVQGAQLNCQDCTHHVTMTFGVSELACNKSVACAIARADSALLEGKRGGRNRVEVAAPKE